MASSKHRPLTDVIQPLGSILVIVRTDTGIALRSLQIPMRSFVRNYWLLMHHLCSQASANSPTMVDTSGASNSSTNRFNFLTNAAAGVTTHGIRVGTSSTPHAYTDHSLGAAVAHGTSDGQLSHGAVSVSYIEASGQGTVSRTLTNNGSVSLTLREVGLIATFPSSARHYLMIKDMLPDIVVAPTQSVEITYTLLAPSGVRSMSALFVRNLCRTTNDLLSWRTTGARDLNVQPSLTSHNFLAAEGAEGSIMLGTGTSGVDFADNDLQNRIAHGTGAGQLFHSQAVEPLLTEDTGTGFFDMTFTRMFTNSSGSPIAVTEAGLFMRHSNGTLGTRMYDRRLLPSAVVISNGESRTFMWKFTYEF